MPECPSPLFFVFAILASVLVLAEAGPVYAFALFFTLCALAAVIMED